MDQREARSDDTHEGVRTPCDRCHPYYRSVAYRAGLSMLGWTFLMFTLALTLVSDFPLWQWASMAVIVGPLVYRFVE